ncbi:malate dehydrogenase (oxaloacetate-decarboxylating) [Amycolatopsis tolypomycina]|uniref:Malate dehydrogenase (Oxaloacetate-decarboxylating) n=1 Tax=Amycolatopsis tolypomycina TaxID=208445 RepID=A0A1H4WBS5_9PSEU|nr:hypothetical protein [Amycolatopsis tolypomycina]SEC90796.1 malate dehydrogenase (oxaloacetate-decarboxylating) [Amycolatopsis tolypomycina]
MTELVLTVAGDHAAAAARLLTDHTPLRAVARTVPADAPGLVAAVRALDADAVFLTGADRVATRTAQLALAGELAVFTAEDTLAIALTAAVQVALSRRGRTPADARVLVAAPSTLPLVIPVLLAAGTADIMLWHPADAAAFPLAQLARDVDVVVDLSGRHEPGPRPAVVAPGDPVAPLLALPGLLQGGPRTGDPQAHPDVHAACARALAGLTPVDRLLPELADPDLASRVAGAVAAARS